MVRSSGLEQGFFERNKVTPLILFPDKQPALIPDPDYFFSRFLVFFMTFLQFPIKGFFYARLSGV
jgi:hypothetical protein